MNKMSSETRNKKIIKTSIIGIIANFILAIFKVVVGFLSGSIAIILDAVNNLSDTLSSIVTIVGVKFANRAPDKNHPLGHGRFEYLGAAIIATVISYIGFTAIFESIGKIINPNEVNYTFVTFLVVSVSVIIKILLGRYYKKVAKQVDSDSLKNSGFDAMMDALISAATIVAGLIYVIWGISIEAYLATLISVFIIYSGFRMLRESFSVILGERVDSDLSRRIKQAICEIDGVYGAYDLLIHDYGTGRSYASVNIDVLDTLSVVEVDDISREVRRLVGQRFRIYVSSVGIFPINTKDKHTVEVRNNIKSMMLMNDHIRQIHGFRIDEKAKEITFDVVIDFSVKDQNALRRRIIKELKRVYPDYHFVISIDLDFSD